MLLKAPRQRSGFNDWLTSSSRRYRLDAGGLVGRIVGEGGIPEASGKSCSLVAKETGVVVNGLSCRFASALRPTRSFLAVVDNADERGGDPRLLTVSERRWDEEVPVLGRASEYHCP
ncbi:hypothetical protein CORC01_02310 [Colletotrichum orchidophilum]|uniref:Uncharacterized protein n=1 Tax=Colletotrichum orchidophilum TaxID=1209926 RepID=A0A1G4BLY7_9PEZI|nr:uncharacterized protein CORC01_02310 [Colletotrichum orchidophilum]OHF02317.1 hypothetical protein CORC01_02310 [Colletotrichum orchidophilum]